MCVKWAMLYLPTASKKTVKRDKEISSGAIDYHFRFDIDIIISRLCISLSNRTYTSTNSSDLIWLS